MNQTQNQEILTEWHSLCPHCQNQLLRHARRILRRRKIHQMHRFALKSILAASLFFLEYHHTPTQIIFACISGFLFGIMLTSAQLIFSKKKKKNAPIPHPTL